MLTDPCNKVGILLGSVRGLYATILQIVIVQMNWQSEDATSDLKWLAIVFLLLTYLLLLIECHICHNIHEKVQANEKLCAQLLLPTSYSAPY